MRIGIVAPPWLPVPPPAYGGTEAVIDRLARGFAAAGHEVVVCTTGDSSVPVPKVYLYEQAQYDRIGNGLVEMCHVAEAYERFEDFDIVHDHTILGPFYAERVPDLPVLTTAHGEFTTDVISLYRKLTGRAGVIAISHDQARRALCVPIARVIHHGLDVDEIPVGEGRGGYVAFLGRMTPDKGVRQAALIAHLAGLPLKIAAKCREPAELEYYRDQVAPLVGGDVEYVGELGGADKLAFLGEARALVNPIQWPEPFGLVMVEALACGTPVLAMRCGSAPEIVDDGVTGFLCDDAAEMVAKLSRIDELDRAECRRVAEHRFSTERMVAEHLDLFEATVRARRPTAFVSTSDVRPAGGDTAYPEVLAS